MQNTTADYKLEINKPSRSFECKITIGNNIYTNEDLVNLTLEYAQPQEGFAIGNTISQSLDLTLLNRGDIIYSTSQIKVEIGLKIGSTIEYILMGIFNIDDIEKTDYTTKITAYDNMIKFETDYFSELGDKPTLKQVVNELSSKTGVEFTGSLPDYNVSKLEGFTCREVLSYVASICGGNAFITRDGKFTIKSLSEVEKSIDGNNYFEYTREEVKYKVGQISCQIDENNILSKGSTGIDSMELGFENPWITETILTEIYNKLNGLSYLGYSMKWQGDLSLDPYDIITVTDVKNVVRKIPILSQKISYTGGLTSEIGAKGETKNKNSFSSSGSTTNKVNRLVTEQAVIKEALIEKANIKDVEAVSIRTQTLEAKTAKIEEAIIDVAYVSDLTAINANIQTLFANDATINNALIGKADITELNAVQGNITSLNSQVANIQTLVNGNLSSENIQAGGITSDKLTIANGFITNAMIANLDVSKINAGDISTNKFRIVSDSGKMLISDNTIQISDTNRVRVQIGKDASNDYNMYVWDSAGKLMFDATGLKADGIKNKIIRDDMISDTANIAGSKINISSLITEINKDTNTTVIKSSKVQLDTVGQTLEVAFNSLKSNVDNMEIGGRNLALNSLFDNMNNIGEMGVGPFTVAPFINQKDFNNISNSIEWKAAEFTENKWLGVGINTSLDKTTLSKGEIFTISFWYYVFSDTSYDSYDLFRVCLKNHTLNKATLIKNIDTTTKDEWIRFEYTGTVSEDLVLENRTLYIYIVKNGHVKITKPKLERGTKATDFTAAPEEVDNSIEAVKQITESNSTTIGVMQGQITTAINNTQIVKDGETVLLKDDYNRTVSLVDSMSSTIGTHTTQISTLNSTVSTQGSSITQLQNQIALKVEQSDITTAINDVQIGGRNLIKKKSNYNYGYLDASNGTINYIGSLNGNQDFYTNEYFSVKQGETICFSSYTKGINSNIQAAVYIHVYNGSKVWQKAVYRVTSTNSGAQTSYKATEDCYVRFSARGFNDYDHKAEYGTKPTDWTPAPEDIDTSIANVQSQVTTTSNKVSTIETNLDSITTRVSSTETEISTITTNVNNKEDKNDRVIYARGTGLDYSGTRILKIGNKVIYNDYGRGARVTALIPTTLEVYSDNLYDLHAGGENETNFVNKINELNDGDYIVIITSQDNAYINYRARAEVLYKIGGLAPKPSVSSYREAYALIGRSKLGKGNGVEMYIPKTANDKRFAEVSVKVSDNGTFMGVNSSNIGSEIDTITTEIAITSSEVAEIVTSLDSITTRVTSTESTVSTHTSQLSTVDSRIDTAKNTAISTAATDATSKANNALTNAKSYTDGQITTVNQTITNKVAEIKTTTDSITQRVSSAESKITTITTDFNNLQIGGRNLVKNSPTLNNSYNQLSTFKGTKTILDDSSAKSGKVVKIECTTAGTGFYCSLWSGDDSCVGKKFTWSFYAKMNTAKTLSNVGHERGGKTSISVTTEWTKFTYTWTYSSSGNRAIVFYPYFAVGDIIYIKDFKIEEGDKATDWTSAPEDVDSSIANVQTQVTTTSNKVTTIETNLNSITSRVSSTESSITTINGNVSSLQTRMTTAEQKITPTAITTTISSAITGGTGSISTTQFVMDKNGLTIKNGALTIQNKSGTTVLSSDTNGNLIITGTLKSQTGDQFVSLDSGGISLQDWNKQEQMLRIGVSYFTSDRNYNGTTFAMPLYADFLRFSYINKADLTNGWASTDTQYNFMDFWSDDRTIDSVKYKKGINIYAPAYINNGLFFNNTSSGVTSDITGNFTWNNGSGDTNNLLGICGDNGLFLGYKAGETYNARIVLTEGAHPGTGDQIRSWGNWNLSGYTLHNGAISATSLTVSGSKNCLQETENYGARLINAYETAEYFFGDLGFARINEDRECLVSIDDIFLECVNTDIEYHVFTQIYNKGSIETIERYKTYFIVKGDPGTSFSWELKAKRIGYENNRLDTQDIVNQAESNIELFSYEDFKVETSEDTLMNLITFELEDFLMEG